MEPVVLAVVEGSAFMGFGAVIPQVSTIFVDLAYGVQVNGLDGVVHLFLDRHPLIQLPKSEFSFCREDVRLLDCVHALGSGLEAFFTPPLVGDHFLDHCSCFGNGEVKERSSSSSIDVGS
jgi:hypothetical protein